MGSKDRTAMGTVTAMSADIEKRSLRATEAGGGAMAITIATIVCISGRTGREIAGAVGDAVPHTTMAIRTESLSRAQMSNTASHTIQSRAAATIPTAGTARDTETRTNTKPSIATGIARGTRKPQDADIAVTNASLHLVDKGRRYAGGSLAFWANSRVAETCSFSASALCWCGSGSRGRAGLR